MSPRRPRAGLRRILLRLAALSVSSLLALTLSEFALRCFAPQVFPVQPPGFYVADEELGYRLVPDNRAVIRRAEFAAEFSTDRYGFRSPGLRLEESGPRILILGDSMAWGFGVEDEETFAMRLEEELRASAEGPPPQVINAAVPGFGTMDFLHQFRRVRSLVRPDAVVLLVLSVSDFEENRSPAVEWAAVTDDGRLTSREGTEATAGLRGVLKLKHELTKTSHLASLVSSRIGYLLMRAGLAERTGLWEDGEDFDKADAEIMRESLSLHAERAEEAGSRFVVAYATGQDKVLMREPPRLRSRELILEACLQAQIPCVDLLASLRSADDRRGLYHPRDGHWTTQGHAEVARALAETLEPMMSPAPPEGSLP